MAGDPIDNTLRPKKLQDFVGQPLTRTLLEVYIKSAKNRDAAMDHVLFYGPPGLGKTTLSKIIASELGVPYRQTHSTALEKPEQLKDILLDLPNRSVLFIDEIHGISKKMEEILYSAMEDQSIEMVIEKEKLEKILGKEKVSKLKGGATVTVVLNPFTLVGATTRPDLLSAPLRDRFGILQQLEIYTIEEMEKIISRACGLLGLEMGDGGVHEIAKRSRGVPRVGSRLLRRVRDFAVARNKTSVSAEFVIEVMKMLTIDDNGLNKGDHKYLKALYDAFGGGPTGIETLSSYLGESISTLTSIIEPYLMQLEFIQRTNGGRVITEKGIEVIRKRSP